MRWKQFLTPVASMDTEEAKAYMAEHEEGTFTLLDVRQPGEYENSRIPGAKLMPLPELADRLGELDPETCYTILSRGRAQPCCCAAFGRKRVQGSLQSQGWYQGMAGPYSSRPGRDGNDSFERR